MGRAETEAIQFIGLLIGLLIGLFLVMMVRAGYLEYKAGKEQRQARRDEPPPTPKFDEEL